MAEQPGGADRRVAGEWQLDRGRVDADPPAAAVLDEDRLAEAELGGDALTLRFRRPRPVEEDAERVSPFALLVDEDPQYMQLGHRSILG